MSEELLEAAKAITEVSREMSEYVAQRTIMREKIRRSVADDGYDDPARLELKAKRDANILTVRMNNKTHLDAVHKERAAAMKITIATIRAQYKDAVAQADKEGREGVAGERREKIGAFDKETAAGVSKFRLKLRQAARAG